MMFIFKCPYRLLQSFTRSWIRDFVGATYTTLKRPLPGHHWPAQRVSLYAATAWVPPFHVYVAVHRHGSRDGVGVSGLTGAYSSAHLKIAHIVQKHTIGV